MQRNPSGSPSNYWRQINGFSLLINKVLFVRQGGGGGGGEREMGWKGDIILPLESGVNCLPPEQNITDSLDFPTSCFP